MLHVWRDLPAVLHVHRLDQGDVCMGPLAFRSFTRLMESEEMDIWLGGVGGDQASSVDLYESSYRVPARALLNQDTNVMWRKTYEAGIARADKVKVRLHGMVASWLVNSRPSLGASNSREARKQINALGSVAEIAYWSILQANHGILIAESNRAALGNTAAEGGEAWENICEQARLRAFSHACPGQTRLQTRARAMVQAGRRGPRS